VQHVHAGHAAANPWHRSCVKEMLYATSLCLHPCAAVAAGARGHVSLLNIITELKKACNHPFLFESAEDEYRWDHSASLHS
jgi:SNF2 family DNA or RNA helicase